MADGGHAGLGKYIVNPDEAETQLQDAEVPAEPLNLNTLFHWRPEDDIAAAPQAPESSKPTLEESDEETSPIEAAVKSYKCPL